MVFDLTETGRDVGLVVALMVLIFGRPFGADFPQFRTSNTELTTDRRIGSGKMIVRGDFPAFPPCQCSDPGLRDSVDERSSIEAVPVVRSGTGAVSPTLVIRVGFGEFRPDAVLPLY